jgi:hypothetical protein
MMRRLLRVLLAGLGVSAVLIALSILTLGAGATAAGGSGARALVGGAGRAFSLLVFGAPHPFFLLLMTIELALPPLLVLLWWRAGGSSASKA